MRLFIAIRFTDEIKKELLRSIEHLKSVSEYGNFTSPENLHLTLAFIGETKRVEDVKRIIDAEDVRPFEIKIGKPGVFHRDGGEIRWIGVDAEAELFILASDIQSKLCDAGFDIDNREFKPHITLARQVICPPHTRLEIEKLSMKVESISLMRSDRIGGKLIYTEIYEKRLG